jgi:hypothetical protein
MLLRIPHGLPSPEATLLCGHVHAAISGVKHLSLQSQRFPIKFHRRAILHKSGFDVPQEIVEITRRYQPITAGPAQSRPRVGV